jgi:hypothetical protein
MYLSLFSINDLTNFKLIIKFMFLRFSYSITLIYDKLNHSNLRCHQILICLRNINICANEREAFGKIW